MDGARGQKLTLADALEVAWARCRARLEAAGGVLAAGIAERARLAAALHVAEQARRAAAAEPADSPTAGRIRP
jgi:hypothetical protein